MLTCHLLPVYSVNVTADGGSMAPYPPPGGPFATPPGQSVPSPTAFVSGGSRPRGAGLAITLGIVAILVAVAALIVALVRGGESSAPASPAAQPSTSSTAAASADTSAVDKALCNAIAPLMTESDQMSNAYTNTGDAGTPARDAALPKFIADTEAWIPRIQAVLDSHPGVRPIFERTLQRYIDDRQLLVWNVEPGPANSYDQSTWADSLAAYGGPLRICHDLGIHW
jgi:hypothetical protein